MKTENVVGIDAIAKLLKLNPLSIITLVREGLLDDIVYKDEQLNVWTASSTNRLKAWAKDRKFELDEERKAHEIDHSAVIFDPNFRTNIVGLQKSGRW